MFYVGSVLPLTLLPPWNSHSAVPLVTVFSELGGPAAGGVMNLVVLTAALSSLNSGLYRSWPDRAGRRLGARRTLSAERPVEDIRMGIRRDPPGEPEH